MVSSTILLKTPTLLPSFTNVRPPSILENCTLRWVQTSLYVTASSPEATYQIPALKNQKWLRDCLLHSPVRRVYLDPAMGRTQFNAWADICQSTGKKVFLMISSTNHSYQNQRFILWKVKWLADLFASFLLLVLLSPLFLLIALLIQADSQGPIIFQQWRVGYQGHLFKIYKFRSMEVDIESHHLEGIEYAAESNKLEHNSKLTRIGYWLRKFSLDELPQLVNVLRGEMSLVGPRPWEICDVMQIESRFQLN